MVTRFQKRPTTPEFWGLFEPKNKEEKREGKRCAKALKKAFSELPLTKDLISHEELNKHYETMLDVASSWDYLGACDTEMRESFFHLLSKHYGVAYSLIHQVWIGNMLSLTRE